MIIVIEHEYCCRVQYGLLCNMDYSIETKEIPIIVYC